MTLLQTSRAIDTKDNHTIENLQTTVMTTQRIAIITIHHVPNYGAVWQAYGLSSYLKSLGHEVTLIDYRPTSMAKYFKPKIGPSIGPWIRHYKFRKFINTQLPLSDRVFTEHDALGQYLADFDLAITGSDQVWFTGSSQGFDQNFFLDFPGLKTRFASYAPSVGSTDSFGDNEPQVREALKRFSHLSVRDTSTLGLVRPLIDHDPTFVIDPSFLPDYSNFTQGEGPAREKDYLLVFGHFNTEQWDNIRAIGSNMGLPIYSLVHPCPDGCKRIAAPSPIDWLRFFFHAKAVVTSYFHGTAFAINFQKPFIVSPTPGRVAKVTSLLTQFELQDRVIPTDGALPESVLTAPIDWPRSRTLIDAAVDQSKQFLHNAVTDA